MLKLKIPPVVVFFICVGLMWWINREFSSNAFDLGFNTTAAVSIFLIGVVIGLLGVIEFARRSTTVNPHRPEHTAELVTSGVYTVSRNPMYLGLLIGLVAIMVYWGNPWTAVILLVFIWYMNEFQVKPEEEVMEQKFGRSFTNYTKKVRRWG